jgi:lipopolysaccharide/colanic/teichoic acid biosynthesis glycosyltransferase
MEPNILASTASRPAPGIGERSPAADEAAARHARPNAPGVAASALVPDLVETDARVVPAVRDGGNGHVRPLPKANGNGNGHAAATTWPGLARATGGHAHVLPLYEAPVARGFYLLVGKRVLDVVGASLGLILASPILLVAAVLIKLESRGPVFYRSTRIGKGARPFPFLKLRSMVDGADRHRHALAHLNETDGPVFKIAADPRVTRVGRLLRVTSVDEIPQLWNVLRGEMSLVGPRPPIAEEVMQYEPWQLRRLDVLPGITCLWQISGRSRIGFQEWMRLDLEYIKHRSFWLDMKILIRTIPAVLSREGAY